MKKLITVSVVALTLFCMTSQTFAADATKDAFRSVLDGIYSSYNEDPAAACLKMEDSLKSPDAATMSPQEQKRAYNFIANGNYQLKNLDKALLYYSKVAELDPADHQPLVYSGSVYVEQEKYVEAEKAYKQALKRVDGQMEREEKIKAMIRSIPGKINGAYKVTTSVGYDSNVNSGPSDTTHYIYDALNYTLENDEKSRDDLYAHNSVAAVFNKGLDSQTSVLWNAGVYNTSYFDEHDFNSTYFSTSVGYKKVYGRKSVTFLPFLNYQILDDKGYQANGGFNVAGAVKVSDKTTLWPQVGWYAQNFYKDSPRDAQGASAGGSAAYAVDELTTVIGSIFYSYNNADNDQYTYNNAYVGGSVYRKIAKRLTASAGYNFQLYYYDEANPVFGSTRRDKGHQVYVNFDYSLDKFLNLEKSYLSFNVSYKDNNSNHSFQENERLFSALKLTISF